MDIVDYMSDYKIINDYLELLKAKRDLSKDKSENQTQLNDVDKNIKDLQKDLILTVESILSEMGLNKRRFLSDFKVSMISDSGLMVEFRTVPSIDFLNQFEKRIGNIVSANYCGDPKKSFFMLKY